MQISNIEQRNVSDVLKGNFKEGSKVKINYKPGDDELTFTDSNIDLPQKIENVESEPMKTDN